MAHHAHIFLFGDQTNDFVPGLRKLLQSKEKPLLSAFLEQAHYVVRAQMNVRLPPKERMAARTSSLAHLLQKYTDGSLSASFQTALHCITQLGCFISYYEEVGRQYPNPSQAYLVGLCTGSLAAAAISSATSLSELLPAAVHTVQVAFRLGICGQELRDRIHTPDPRAGRDWSAVFFGLDEASAAAAISDFSKSKALPNTARPWISATAAKATTISAPPPVLQSLRRESSLSKCRSKNISIFLPSHSSRLFTTRDVDFIMATTNAEQWAGFAGKIPIISGATGRPVWSTGLVSLLRQALCDCLLEPIHWDQVLESFPDLVASRELDTITIVPLATNLEQNLLTALKPFAAANIEYVDSKPTMLPSTSASKARLAIVGMSGRFPEAQNPEAFWNIIYQGLDVCKEVPAKRWNHATHIDPSGKGRNKGLTKWGCWLDFAGEFDARFFSISPKEAPQMDPAQRMALMSTHEALEQAGFVLNTTPSSQNDRVGVFHGVTSNDYLECNSGQDIDTYFITGGNRAFIPGRINFCFEFCGPSYTNDSACSSSLAAIHLACNSLWRGDCDTAVAGGTNMIFNPDGHTGLDKGFFLSQTGNCKTFDDKADGYCRAEGVGTVIIKRLDDALAENDPILAVILDTKTNHSATADSMTRPHVGAQIDNMNAVLNESGIDPRLISYVEMHGTGTQVGDAVEMESVLRTFAPDESFRPDHPLYVGSAKANVGHGEGVSGVVSLAKVLLMMKNDIIPPHCGIKPGSKINHNFPDLGARNVHIAMEPKPWKRESDVRRVLINNFSAAGGNTALLIEDAPVRHVNREKDPRTSHIVTVSGHVAASLKNNLQSLLEYIDKSDPEVLPQLSYTTTARRAHYLFRVAVTGKSMDEIKRKLQQARATGDGTTRPKAKPRVLFAFTGQGSQYIGMGNQLVNAFPSFRSDIHNFDQLSQSLGLPSFIRIITDKDGDIDQYPPVISQLATTSLQIALARLIQSFGIDPSAVAGHSLGEYAALNVAGILSVSDTLFLVGKRAQLLQERCERGTHAMLAIKASPSSVAGMLKGKKYEIACVNGPDDTVISGENEQIGAARTLVTKNGTKSILLKVPFAFHSAQVTPILESFRSIAAGATFHKPAIPVLCPLTGKIVQDEGVFGPSYLARHCRETVNMAEALQHAYKSQTLTDKTYTIEIGPAPVVCGMVKATLGPQMPTLPLLQRNKDAWPNITAALQSLYKEGQDIDWVEYHAPFKGAHNVLELPAYGWDLKEYFIPYENDWCIYKPYGPPNNVKPGTAPKQVTFDPGNEKPAVTAKSKETPTIMAKSEPKVSRPRSSTKPKAVEVAKPQSTTIHSVIEDTVANQQLSLVYETDLTRADVSRVVQGHVVNNIPFCTPSVFADMAFILGDYVMSRFFPNKRAILEVADIVAEKVLIPHGRGPQPMRISLKCDLDGNGPSALPTAQCEFYSVNARGMKTARHSACTLRFADDTQYRALQNQVPSYLAKIKRLRDRLRNGDLVEYSKVSGYKLMDTVAQFHSDYKLLDNVVLDQDSLEATCTMDFSCVQPGGTYAAHPAEIDAITQLGGFMVNAQDCINLEEEVYISHGWDSLQVYKEMKADKPYQLYAKMHRRDAEFYHGDTILLQGNTVVAFFKDVTVHRVSRKTHTAVMKGFVHKEGGAKQTAPAQKSNALPSAQSAKRGLQTPTPAAPKPRVALQQPKARPRSTISAASMFDDLATDDSVLSKPTPDRASANAIPSYELPLSKESTNDGLPKIRTAVLPPSDNTFQSQPTALAEKVSSGDNAKIEGAMAIVSEESGIDPTELTDDSNFADIGVDSLLSMVIASRFREELNIDLEADFKLFVDCPTVKQLRVFLGGSPDGKQDSTSEAETDVTVPSEKVSLLSSIDNATSDDSPSTETLAEDPLDAYSEPQMKAFEDEEEEEEEEEKEEEKEEEEEEDYPPPQTKEVVLPPVVSDEVEVSTPSSSKVIVPPSVSSRGLLTCQMKYPSNIPTEPNSTVSAALAIVSEESGIAIPDLTDDSNFADVGVDSLLSMVIASRFREELGLQLEADFSIFADLPTVKDLKAFLSGDGSKGKSSEDSSDSNDEQSSSSLTTPDESGAEETPQKSAMDHARPATSVILQGLPRVAAKTLFLLPDGSGSASSYVQMPGVKGDIAIVGLNCPYVRDPEYMNCTPAAMISSYCNEIRRRQPSGPYHLGGWSAGGAFSFACAERLIKQHGEEVHSLIIVDAPLPQSMDYLPPAFYDYCSQIGLYGDEEPPEYLIPHFTKTIEVMLPYKAKPLKAHPMPKVGILWACDTVLDGKGAPKIKNTTHFMTKKRREFGPDGWDTVLPGAEFIIDRAVGANHFTMMQKGHVHQITELVDAVMA